MGRKFITNGHISIDLLYMERRFKTHSRVINDLFAQYGNTFVAFCELINNSIQANAKNIYIFLDYPKPEEISSLAVKKIVIKDDGIGVSEPEFGDKITYIGTDSKTGGKGIGRFAALQIGAMATIETVGYDEAKDLYTKIEFSITEDFFRKNKDLSQTAINSNDSVLEGKQSTYYQVTIEELYDFARTEKDKKKRLDEHFLITKIKDAIFTRYPIKIFNKEVKFYVNNEYLDPKDFVIGKPDNIKTSFKDKKGDDHDILFRYFNITSQSSHNIKVFLTVRNAGIDTIAATFDFDAKWLSPKIGSWFVYIDSELFTTDILRNFDFGDLGDDNAKLIRTHVKDHLNGFFREKNKEFDDFKTKLRNDRYYPYKQHLPTSNSKVIAFDKLAYLVEEKYHILKEESDIREIVYPLIDKSIGNGNFKNILSSILKLDKKFVERFNDLLEKTELEQVIEFSEKVARKQQDLEFLDKIVYSEISKHILERKQLHKVIEKMLWVFGEQYGASTNLLSDKNLENNLNQLRAKFLEYKPNKEKDNFIDLQDKKLKSITDLFMYSERILDEESREVLIVELKAPKVKISSKELQQVKDYAFEVESKGKFSSNINYKILLVGSDFTAQTSSEIKATSKGRKNPYFYHENADRDIEIWVIKWSDLIENTKRKLSYLSNVLKIKDVDVKEKFETDFENINIEKISSRLQKADLFA